MLVYDRNGTGDVDNLQAFQFPQCSPGATSDMEALADVFDTNDDGKLNASDDRWSKFKVLVTSATRTRVLKAMDEFGITEVSLMADDNGQVFSDGARILGSDIYFRAGSSERSPRRHMGMKQQKRQRRSAALIWCRLAAC